MQNEHVRWRPYYLARIELFFGGIATETEVALGALRIPVIVGGSLLAIVLGMLIDPEVRSSLRRARL